MLRPLTRRRTAPPYERARLAADALKARAQAVGRTDRPAGRRPGAETDVDTVNQTRRMLAEATLARVLDGARERALLARDSRPQPAVAVPPPHTRQPGTQHTRAEPQEEPGEPPRIQEAERRPPGSRAGLAPAMAGSRKAAARRDAHALSRVRQSIPPAVATMQGTTHRVEPTSVRR
ncbi:hypothetical protein [Streptomyces sp. NPDC048266]|uniref:hypothetical protein n=1 Tax=Streptomyces sp. NPDC048266 TaxID=3155787 RepID=UPI0033C5E354